MPWTPSDAMRHNHKCTTKKLRHLWAKVANETLARDGDEGKAIRIANHVVDRQRRAHAVAAALTSIESMSLDSRQYAMRALTGDDYDDRHSSAVTRHRMAMNHVGDDEEARAMHEAAIRAHNAAVDALREHGPDSDDYKVAMQRADDATSAANSKHRDDQMQMRSSINGRRLESNAACSCTLDAVRKHSGDPDLGRRRRRGDVRHTLDAVREHMGLARALTYKEKKSLPDHDFVIVKHLPNGKVIRKYPIYDEDHARNALSRVSTFGSPSVQKKVRAAVRRRYPNIKQGVHASVYSTASVDEYSEVCMDSELLLRLMEWARESHEDDDDLHDMVEDLMNNYHQQGQPLGMEDFQDIIDEDDRLDDPDEDGEVESD